MDSFMAAALEEAQKGLLHGGVPIGSVLVHNQQIVGRGHNQRVQRDSVILHAEMDALENAGRKSASYYQQCTLYTTLSPCPMCAGAVLLYGIPKVVIGENLNFKGEEDLLKARGVELEVLNLSECVSIMQDFIKKNPRVWNEDIGV